MRKKMIDSFNTRRELGINGKKYSYFSLKKLEDDGVTNLDRLPFSIRVLLENALRNEDDKLVHKSAIENIAQYNAKKPGGSEIPFMPARVVLQDFTGVPAVVDLAAMRDAIKKMGGDPSRINPIVRADLVIDHSVQVDNFGAADSAQKNVEIEYRRNRERYMLLKWAQKSFRNFNAVPPGTGIVHQVNLEYLADVVMTDKLDGETLAYPDTLVGTDSHTTMINGLSILGWGVGGIEAEAVMLGQPYYMLLPEVVGVKLTGKLKEGATATDLVLTVTEKLRRHGVVGKFVEYFGPGLTELNLPDRATLANMSPEYGATMGFFPIDEAVIDYLKLTARPAELIELVENYAKAQKLYRHKDTPDPEFSAVLDINMSEIEPSLAGPKRPQDRILLPDMKSAFSEALIDTFKKDTSETVAVNLNEQSFHLSDGSVVIAAITSCTNTSNPAVMVGAGLLAKKANEKGLKVKPWVKTSLAPGSRVVTEYLKNSNLLAELDAQGFNLVGYGCTTCIGNSGPLAPEIETAISGGKLIAAAVLSGNRNFEGRIHAAVKANYLASPPLVVAYALAGTVNIDLKNEPIGKDKNGNAVFLKDIWPSQSEILETLKTSLDAKTFAEQYKNVFEGDEIWRELKIEEGQLFEWEADSTYIKNPPFFENMSLNAPDFKNIRDARVLVLLGDSTTTDHISPAGAIPSNSPAGKYLIEKGLGAVDFNSFGSRRGNHEVMMRGTFGNIRVKNQLLEGVEGGYTRYLPSGEQMFIYDAAMRYQAENTPLIVIAGKEYGTGSSRDWAAKGTTLLGVKAVIAESYERIHRSNLIGMGVLPLQFLNGDNWKSLGLTGAEFFDISGIDDKITPGKELVVVARNAKGFDTRFNAIARLDTPVEIDYYKNGGILKTVLRQMIAESK